MTYQQIESRNVDRATGKELTSAVRSMAEAVSEPGLGRVERANRARHLADTAGNLRDTLPLLNPYAGTGHSRVHDMMVCRDMKSARINPYRGNVEDAADRLAQHRAYSEIRAWADLSALNNATAVHPSGTGRVESAQFLAQYAAPTSEPVAPPVTVGQVTELPDAILNPSTENELVPGNFTVDAVTMAWRTAAFAVNESTQLVDFTEAGAAEAERLAELVVNAALERALLADLTNGAPTAADLDAAESAVGAVWPTGPDVVLISAADRPKVRKNYAGIDPADRPRLIATGGVEAGTAVVLATGAALIEARALQFTSIVEPANLGTLVVAMRDGRAHLRVAGAAQLVSLA